MRSNSPYSGKLRRKDDDGFTIRPFEKLAKLLPGGRGKSMKSVPRPAAGEQGAAADADGNTETDQQLFNRAMAGVTPLSSIHDDGEEIERELSVDNRNIQVQPSAKHDRSEDTEALQELKALVRGERPINVRQTPEYVEGCRRHGCSTITKKLHSGAFAVQGYCDLHGMDSITALDVCKEFMLDALGDGKRCVAFIHGRGLSSPGRPVLKRLVIEWLSRGPYRKYVIAFASAPAWDGGAGVTYVLLRNRKPVSRIRG